MFAGKFTRRKGIDRLIEVARSMPQVSFEAVGWGDGFDGLNCPDNLQISNLRGAEYKAALAKAAILLLPSRAETFGLVIYEAMQAGCSVISTIPGNYAGEMIPNWTTQRAVAAIAQRINNLDQVFQEGSENRNRVKTLTWEHSTDQILDLYRRICPEVFSIRT